MRNVIAVIHAHPVLRAAAAESKAFELFVAAVDDLTDFHDEQASSRTELAQLAARKTALIEDINLLIARLHATAALLPPRAPKLAPFAPLSTRLSTQEFTVRTHSIVEMTAKEADVFVENGLHPRTFATAYGVIGCTIARIFPSVSLNHAVIAPPPVAIPFTVRKCGLSYSSNVTPFARSASTSARTSFTVQNA